MYRLAHERSGHKCADEKRFIAKMVTATVFRALAAGRASRQVASAQAESGKGRFISPSPKTLKLVLNVPVLGKQHVLECLFLFCNALWRGFDAITFAAGTAFFIGLAILAGLVVRIEPEFFWHRRLIILSRGVEAFPDLFHIAF